MLLLGKLFVGGRAEEKPAFAKKDRNSLDPLLFLRLYRGVNMGRLTQVTARFVLLLSQYFVYKAMKSEKV
jgi:hypothetical protein